MCYVVWNIFINQGFRNFGIPYLRYTVYMGEQQFWGIPLGYLCNSHLCTTWILGITVGKRYLRNTCGAYSGYIVTHNVYLNNVWKALVRYTCSVCVLAICVRYILGVYGEGKLYLEFVLDAVFGYTLRFTIPQRCVLYKYWVYRHYTTIPQKCQFRSFGVYPIPRCTRKMRSLYNLGNV